MRGSPTVLMTGAAAWEGVHWNTIRNLLKGLGPATMDLQKLMA